jgi:hypothetical protein
MQITFSFDGTRCVITGLDGHLAELIKSVFSQIHQSTNREVGINTTEPETTFHVAGDSLFRGSVQIDSNSLGLRYSNLKLFGPTVGGRLDCREDQAGNTAALRVNAAVIDGLNQFQFNVGDDSACSGGLQLNVFRGDGSTNVNHRLSGNTNSFLAASAGNVGIGLVNPVEKFHVNGVIRAVSLKLGTTPSAWTWGTAAPTTGTAARGDIVWHRSPVAAGNVAWICTTAGTPGTWKSFGSIAM